MDIAPVYYDLKNFPNCEGKRVLEKILMRKSSKRPVVAARSVIGTMKADRDNDQSKKPVVAAMKANRNSDPSRK